MITNMQVFRHATVLALGSEGPDVDVRCLDSSLGGQHMDTTEACCLPSPCGASVHMLSLVTGGPLHGLRRSICRQALACSCLAVRTLLQSAGLACRTHQGVKSIGMPHGQHDRRCVSQRPSPADGCCALQVLTGMKSSVFCLVLPGDSQSSRWTSQVVMSGCVPVFVGPPYASMPFPIDFGYGFASLVFNITDTR